MQAVTRRTFCSSLRLRKPVSLSSSRAYATEASSSASKVLLFLEHRDGKLNPGSLNALSAATSLGGDIVGLVTGEAQSAAKIADAAKK